jgi:DNA (cytosine-5)-methyltransferase 1
MRTGFTMGKHPPYSILSHGQLTLSHQSLTWIQEDSSLVQLSQADINNALSHCAEGLECLSCGLKKAKDIQQGFRLIPPRGFFQRGHKYHVDDFVYILPSNGSSTLYKIGRITKIKAMDSPPQAYIRLYDRFDKVVRKMRENNPILSSLHTDEV